MCLGVGKGYALFEWSNPMHFTMWWGSDQTGNLKNFLADVYPHLSVRELKTKKYINNPKLFHAKQVFSRITFNSTLRSRLTLKSKIAFTRTWKDLLTVNHESQINKSLNHVSREKIAPITLHEKSIRDPLTCTTPPAMELLHAVFWCLLQRNQPTTFVDLFPSGWEDWEFRFSSLFTAFSAMSRAWVRLFDSHFSLVHFSNLNYISAREMRHNTRQSDKNCCLKKVCWRTSLSPMKVQVQRFASKRRPLSCMHEEFLRCIRPGRSFTPVIVLVLRLKRCMWR